MMFWSDFASLVAEVLEHGDIAALNRGPRLALATVSNPRAAMLVQEGERIEVASFDGGEAGIWMPRAPELVQAREGLHVPEVGRLVSEQLLHALRPSDATPLEAPDGFNFV